MAGIAGTYNSPARIAQTMGIAAYRSALGGFLDRDRRLPPPQPQRLTHGWKSDDPEAWIAGELGGYVHGLDSIFDEAQKRNLPQPQSIDKLHEHLRVKGDADFIGSASMP